VLEKCQTCVVWLYHNQPKGNSVKTSIPDFVSDFQIQFEEWALSEHFQECLCQSCDPEFHIELNDDFDWSLEYDEG